MGEAHTEAEVEAGNTGARKTLTCILKNENQADIGTCACPGNPVYTFRTGESKPTSTTMCSAMSLATLLRSSTRKRPTTSACLTRFVPAVPHRPTAPTGRPPRQNSPCT